MTEQPSNEEERKRDDILRRMLKMPPKPYTPKSKREKQPKKVSKK